MPAISGGDKLIAHLQGMNKKLSQGKELHVGFLSGATYPGTGMTVAAVAAIQNFGAPGAKFPIPPRPFFTNMIRDKGKGWAASVAKILVQTDYDEQKTLELMGQGIRGQLQDAIVNMVAPPLSPTTLMLRKMKAQNPGMVMNYTTVLDAQRRVAQGNSTSGVSTKPLVDTGHLLNSADYEVV